ncbi:MAG TPA: hypothetical protein VFN55_00320 [Solirubrobacteraceae bacterium]|nr:hypothetical protein [Solirubrobacteraceae bacterium]
MTPEPGDLVTVAGSGAPLDGIVFETPSAAKAVVAVVDAKKGPVFRSVHPDTLSAREGEGPHDRALRLLIKRTPPAAHGATRGPKGSERGRAGFTRGTAHRSTGR